MKKKIAIIGVKGFPAFGGSARATDSVINILKDKYDFTVYTLKSHTDENYFTDASIKQIVLRGFKYNMLLNTFFYYIQATFHVLFRESFDLIHLNHGPSGYILPFLKLKYNVILTLRGVYTPDRYDEKFGFLTNKFFKVFQYIGFKFSDALVSVSKYEMEYCKANSNVNVYHIPNGVNTNETISPEEIGFSEYLLFSANRIYDIKGLDVLFKALNHIEYKGKLLVIGDLSHSAKYKELLEGLGVNLDISYIGLIKDKSLLMKYINQSKIFIFPSRKEGMSNMLLEVVSMKCPVICSSIPANTDFLDASEAIFYETEDYVELGVKIEWAIKNYDDVLDMANKAYEKVVSKYNWYYISELYDNLYTEIINQKHKYVS